jgi:hypothetical protein
LHSTSPLLSLVNAVVASVAMTPSFFADTAIGMIVTHRQPFDRPRATFGDRPSCTGVGIDAALLRESPDSPTNKGFQTLLSEKVKRGTTKRFERA